MGEVWPEVELVAPEGEPPVEDGESFAENALIKARGSVCRDRDAEYR